MTDSTDVPDTKILTRRTKNELKQITKLIRETNYILTQTTDLETIKINLHWKHTLLTERNKIITETIGLDIIPEVDIIAIEIKRLNLKKQIRRFERQDVQRTTTEQSTPELKAVELPKPIKMKSEITMADKTNINLKDSQHHYAGFYSSKVLQPLNNKVAIKTKNDKVVTTVINEPCINIGKSGLDTIITEQPIVKIDNDVDVPPGSLVMHPDTQEIYGAITSRQKIGKQTAYPVQDGFRRANVHLSVPLQREIKSKPIAYADKQFDNKNELTEYLSKLPPQDPSVKATLLTDRDNMNTQLIIHSYGRNIANIQLRHRLVDPYHEPPKYKPYTASTCHREGF